MEKCVETLTIPEPNPKQVEFFQARARFIAYGGARGGGKSWAIRQKAKLLALRYGAGSDTAYGASRRLRLEEKATRAHRDAPLQICSVLLCRGQRSLPQSAQPTAPSSEGAVTPAA